MSRHLAGSSIVGKAVSVRLLALTTAAATLCGFIATPQASASAGATTQTTWAPASANERGPIRTHNHGRHNQNAPAINSPSTHIGVQQVNSVSKNTITQSGRCGGRRCKISQRLRFSQGGRRHGGWRSKHGHGRRR
ncbi:hypothetical protein [Planotetraspora phitsanulokensis]|nr:hypothetical protein [Planotetraspora phitsanulokensis]